MSPVVARCPACAATLSETSVIALAPVCDHCGAVITLTGGSLGLTGVYGVNDPTVTRERKEADLRVLREYRSKYLGMLEASKEQLLWNVNKYVVLPQKPEWLRIKRVPKVINFGGVFPVALACTAVGGLLLGLFLLIGGDRGALSPNGPGVVLWFPLLFFGFWTAVVSLPFFLFSLPGRIAQNRKAIENNGDRPLENARRQAAYEIARAESLKSAEATKAAADHRLRCQIRQLEALIKTMTSKIEEVSRL